MYYLVELLDIICVTRPLFVKYVKYFMYKNKIVYDDWFNDLSNIFNRIDNQSQKYYTDGRYLFSWCYQGT